MRTESKVKFVFLREVTEELISEVKYLKETKNLSITQIAKVTGRARSTIYKVLKEELNYIPYNRLVKANQMGERYESK